ncbi:hypothetical protein DRD23_08615 [Salmonella enterica subsp. enterica serovar Enteritidis]|nr:hypothetical protein [Salmonella enterica subsp. enterica serovar Enteritidis]
MKILSKVHDYYDSAAAYGVSDQYWKRQNDITYRKDPDLEDILRRASCWGGTPTIIMFCGKAYAVISLQGPGWPPEIFLVTKPEDFDAYRRIYEAGLKPPYPGKWPQLDPQPSRWRSRDSYADQGFQAFMDDVAKLDCEKYHREYNAPILHISSVSRDCQSSYQDNSGRHRRKVTVQTNPWLKAIGFQKVKDAFTAYQELDSYIFGVLGVDANPIVQTSDKDRLVAHGFDNRVSFRNMKR